MVVQHNLTAMNSNRMLNVTTKSQAKSTEKLSSGYRINRAADDASGLSISEKMRKQIRGLSQASDNAQDGISAVQTAEGALTEVHDMLQRMNELAVKAANGTQSEDDKKYIQDEIDQLVTEIDRVSETTKFNEIYLLKGNNNKNNTYNNGLNGVTLGEDDVKLSDLGTVGNNSTAGKDGSKASGFSDVINDKYFNTDGTISVSGDIVINMFAVDATGATPTDTEMQDTDELDNLKKGATDYDTGKKYIEYHLMEKNGETTSIRLYADAAATIAATVAETGVKVFTYSQLDSFKNAVTSDIRGNNSYIKSLELNDDFNQVKMSLFSDEKNENLSDALAFDLQVGADTSKTNKIGVNIQAMSASNLGINGLRVDGAGSDKADAAVNTIAAAIQKVSTQRSALGAAQNRLEHTINNLDNIVENTTSAESAIRDTDMAEEMVRYSNNNILAQAGQSMLAQANQSNQGVLSLLG